MSRTRILCPIIAIIALLIIVLSPDEANAISLSNSTFSVQTGASGEISSLKLVGDLFPTEYVMNATTSPSQNTSGHQWVGELMFTYRIGTGSWVKANTNVSKSGRTITQDGNSVVVTYKNATETNGIKNFEVVETYTLEEDHLLWKIALKNTGTQSIEFGDIGMPLPFNEIWPDSEAIYETRVIVHTFVGNNSSFVTAKRPSGMGPFILLTPDASTGAGFEYVDHWRAEEQSETMWCEERGGWAEGLNVCYIHSNSIKSTGRGYLPNTSLTLSSNQEKTYAFKIHKVTSEENVRETLYNEGLVDVNVVPGMVFPVNMKAKVDLHTSKEIKTVTPQYPSETVFQYVSTAAADHKIYDVTLSHLGPNLVTVEYGDGEKTVLQFYAMEALDAAIQRHSTFIVEKTQWNSSASIYNKVFDDWMMDTKAKRGVFDGYWGWGDDWGYTHGQFLAEKNVYTPVASEVSAVDEYLETAIWKTLMKEHQTDYLVHDFLMPEPNTTPTVRGYAYPHIYNTYFSMYKISKLHPEIVTFKNPSKTYLQRCYNIFKTLYDGDKIEYNWKTGLMGELTTPEIIQALTDEGMTTEANDLKTKMATKYDNFKSTTYPYGSEYSYDNTGEEAVYMLAKMNSNTTMMSKINDKTRACRGWQPVWYYYSVPVTICGENWWNFQYTAALAGYCMDDWMKYYSITPGMDARGVYAAKLANFSCINSGQINSDAVNIGTVAWTYQAEKGNLGAQGFEGGKLHNGWRNMAGEADLGLFGALKIISADVAKDPVFGLFGYGCDVSETGSTFTVTPKDGLYKRITMVNLGMHLAVEQDRIITASIGNANNYVELNLKNMKTASHTNKITVYGLDAGTYYVYVDDVNTGTVTAVSGKNVDVVVTAGSKESYNVKIQNSQVSSKVPLNAISHTSMSISRVARGYKITYSTEKIGKSKPVLSIYSPDGAVVARYRDLDNRSVYWMPEAGRIGGGVYLVRLQWPDTRTTLTKTITHVQ